MSVRGWVQACEWQRRGSELTADVALDGIVLPIEDLTDFDDAGGILSINDQTIAYDDGAVDEDAGTILVNTGLAAAATTGDPVYTYAGGQVLQDVVLFVDCGDGEPVEVRVPFAQRDYWPEGDYDDPVEVVLSDDLETVLDAPGRLPQSTELTETRGGFEGTLQDIYDAADAAAAAAADAASNATVALTAANGKNKVTYSLSTPGSTPNTAGDIWFRKDSLTQTIIGQWQGQGGTSWQQVTLNDQVIANLDAGKLVAGSAFTNALWVKTNFTLGDASTNGVIQTYNFAGSSVGVYIDKFGIVAKGGSIAGASITGASISGGTITSVGLMSVNEFVATTVDAITSVETNGFMNAGGTIHSDSDVTATGDVKGGRLFATSPDTNSDATVGNAVRMGPSGQLLKITSAARFKSDIQPADIDFDAWEQLEVVTYDHQGEGRGLGVIADQAAELGLTRWVGYDEDGEIETFKYDGMDPVLLAFAQRQARQIADLTARIDALEAR